MEIPSSKRENTVMGCAFSSHSPETEHSRELSRELARAGAADARVIKLLLLGAGDSGKSTIMKQVRLLHIRGFTPEELKAARPVILQNVYEAMAALVEECGNELLAASEISGAARLVRALALDGIRRGKTPLEQQGRTQAHSAAAFVVSVKVKHYLR